MAALTKPSKRAKVLIAVMTYPHPSKSYRELICTAGISESGEWIRLYPVDYRYRPPHQQFRKYQWIEVELEGTGKGNDKRIESRRPNLETIKVLGQPLPTADQWAERRAIVDRLPHHTLNKLRELHDAKQVSLGIIRPTRVLDLEIADAEGDWKPEWQGELNQLRLFGPPPKPLRKLPYKFTYIFECADSAKPHRATITDWELGTLFLKEADRLASDKAAAESVKKKFFGELCRADKDTRFFMGTFFPYNTWLVLGVFWPPKIIPKLVQQRLL